MTHESVLEGDSKDFAVQCLSLRILQIAGVVGDPIYQGTGHPILSQYSVTINACDGPHQSPMTGILSHVMPLHHLETVKKFGHDVSGLAETSKGNEEATGQALICEYISDRWDSNGPESHLLWR